MIVKNKEEKIKNLLKAMKQERGYLSPSWVYAAEKDVDFMEAYNNLYNKVLTDEKVLSIKVRELIIIAILAFRGNESGVYNHIKRALNHGATKQEILEALEILLIPGGAPTFSTGLRALMKVEQEKIRKRKGV